MPSYPFPAVMRRPRQVTTVPVSYSPDPDRPGPGGYGGYEGYPAATAASPFIPASPGGLAGEQARNNARRNNFANQQMQQGNALRLARQYQQNPTAGDLMSGGYFTGQYQLGQENGRANALVGANVNASDAETQRFQGMTRYALQGAGIQNQNAGFAGQGIQLQNQGMAIHNQYLPGQLQQQHQLGQTELEGLQVAHAAGQAALPFAAAHAMNQAYAPVYQAYAASGNRDTGIEPANVAAMGQVLPPVPGSPMTMLPHTGQGQYVPQAMPQAAPAPQFTPPRQAAGQPAAPPSPQPAMSPQPNGTFTHSSGGTYRYDPQRGGYVLVVP